MIDISKRDRPKKYIEATLQLFKEMGGTTIVEVGSMRQMMMHDVDTDTFPCCSDGHSSVLFGRAGYQFFTVDIDENNYRITEMALSKYRGCYPALHDGIAYLSRFSKKIDLLFLDAWDVDSEGCAENHVAAFHAAEDKLAPANMILVDDTDVDYIDNELRFVKGVGGKGRLLAPLLLSKGYIQYQWPWSGNRQSLFIKGVA